TTMPRTPATTTVATTMPPSPNKKIRNYSMDIKSVLSEYLRFPGISADPSAKQAIADTAKFLAGLLSRAGATPQIVETAGNPIVVGRFNAERSDLPHVIIYGHYDVQPVDPVELWETPPFEPTFRDGKIFARGSADNRGPHAVAIVAFANLLARRPDLPIRATFVIEGEEEIGSGSFPQFLRDNKAELSTGDFVMLSDTESPARDLIAITIGLRGVVGLEVEFEGPNCDLHSGIFGGAIYNPLQALAEICASLHKPDGTVNVPGFYDDMTPPAGWERNELARLPQTDESLKKFCGTDALHCLPGYSGTEATRFAPTLEFNGIGGGYQGAGSKTIVPAKAFAKITCRLVPAMSPDDIFQKVSAAILARVPAGIRAKITRMQECPPYYICPPNHADAATMPNRALAAAFSAAHEIIAAQFGNPPVYTRDGGSIGIVEEFRKVCGLNSLMLGFFLPESKIHSPNENIDVAFLEKGVKTYEAVFEKIADAGKA
ncbi:MAG: M20/M25/M40 family metallo-hydrolase, partial [Opitutae bacterium]|nr:M20/M25/M40 family metallo-hydrolase [Opitutae bacterium]